MHVPAKAVWSLALTGALLAAATLGHRPFSSAADRASRSEKEEPEAVVDPMGPNGACYVCHMTFVREEISKVHLGAKTGCVDCHGTSAAHANDEDIGATKPDIVFQKNEVDRMCAKCHKAHDVPAREVVARFVQRKLSGRAICTDCHGTHRIERAAEGDAP